MELMKPSGIFDNFPENKRRLGDQVALLEKTTLLFRLEATISNRFMFLGLRYLMSMLFILTFAT